MRTFLQSDLLTQHFAGRSHWDAETVGRRSEAAAAGSWQAGAPSNNCYQSDAGRCSGVYLPVIIIQVMYLTARVLTDAWMQLL